MARKISNELSLDSSIGYIRFAKYDKDGGDEKQERWVPLELRFGLPLFDLDLNRQVCHRIEQENMFSAECLRKHSLNSRKLCLRLYDFISDLTGSPTEVVKSIQTSLDETQPHYLASFPLTQNTVVFDNGQIFTEKQ